MEKKPNTDFFSLFSCSSRSRELFLCTIMGSLFSSLSAVDSGEDADNDNDEDRFWNDDVVTALKP